MWRYGLIAGAVSITISQPPLLVTEQEKPVFVNTIFRFFVKTGIV